MTDSFISASQGPRRQLDWDAQRALVLIAGQSADLLFLDAAWVAVKREFDELYSFFGGSMYIPPHWTAAFSGFQRGQFWTGFWLGLLDPEGHCVDLREPNLNIIAHWRTSEPNGSRFKQMSHGSRYESGFHIISFLLNKSSLVFFFLTNWTRHNIAKKPKHLSRTYPFEARSQIQKHRNICSVWYI